MTRQEQEQAVARAYEAAQFDERSPEERGFAERFEKEFKPKLIAGIGFNFDVVEARKKRKKIFLVLFIVFVLLSFPVAIFLQDLGAEFFFEYWIYAPILLGIGGWSYVVRKRPNEEDPNHALLLGAVLERFGCTIGSDAPLLHPAGKNAPIRPSHTSMRVLPDYVKGTFDGRIPFTAWRAVARKKQGKHTMTVFKGWHLEVELPFSFAGTTVLREHDALATNVGTSMEDVHLEDPDFSGRFSVRSNDQVEARMILSPDVMHHLFEESQRLRRAQHERMTPLMSGLLEESRRFKPNLQLRTGSLLMGFSGRSAHVWIPSWKTEFADWRPLEPAALIEDLHDMFDELSDLRAFLRDIDVIAESEGFRAQAAKGGAVKAS